MTSQWNGFLTGLRLLTTCDKNDLAIKTRDILVGFKSDALHFFERGDDFIIKQRVF